MNSKEIIKSIIRHDNPPRIGFHFKGDYPTDIKNMASARFTHPDRDKYKEFGYYPELLKLVPDFGGEVRLTCDGNLYGRLGGTTKGECIMGALQEDWEQLEGYTLPSIDEEFDKTVEQRHNELSDKYILSGLNHAVFAPLRDTRRIDNALMDTILEPENVQSFLEMVLDLNKEVVKRVAKNGADGVIIYDDLGMQHAPFFSTSTFVNIFKPFYRGLADSIHANGMDFFVHSCGRMTDFIPHFIDAGVDVFQFDQPELHGSEFLAREYGRSATFYCPVDIQKIMPTGDKRIITEGSINMVNNFKKYGGSLIVKDYGAWSDINVKDEWVGWSNDTVIENAKL